MTVATAESGQMNDYLTENTFWGAFWDSWGESPWANRFSGLAMAAGGAAQSILAVGGMFTGAAAIPATGGASIIVVGVSGLVLLNGIDNVQAGVRQMWSGEQVQTATSSVVEDVTGSRFAGELADAGIGLIGPAGVAKLSNMTRLKMLESAGDDLIQIATGGAENAAEAATFVRTVLKGEKIEDIIQECKVLTWQTGREHAVLKMEDGTRIIVQGGPTGMVLPNATKYMYVHTHPYGKTAGPSSDDFASLEKLDQPFSYVLENGVIYRFFMKDGKEFSEIITLLF